MSLDIQVLSFIENNSPIKREDVERMLLWVAEDIEYSNLLKAIRNADINKTIDRLLEENYLEERNGLLYISKKTQKTLREFIVGIMAESRRLYSLELLWVGKILGSTTPIHLEQLEERISDRIRQNSCVQYSTPTFSKIARKIEFRLRYFKIELSLTVRETNFLISSRATIPDIPKTEGIKETTSPLTEIPTDRDIFSIITAPNISANFFLFKILENAIKELEPSTMVMISLSEFRLLRGEDQLE